MILFIMAIVINGVKPSLFEVISKTYRNNSTIHNESNTTKNDVIRVVYDGKFISSNLIISANVCKKPFNFYLHA